MRCGEGEEGTQSHFHLHPTSVQPRPSCENYTLWSWRGGNLGPAVSPSNEIAHGAQIGTMNTGSAVAGLLPPSWCKVTLQLFLLLLLLHSESLADLPADSELQVRFPRDGGVRDKRQIQTGFNREVPDLSDIRQGCEIQGYETREREICEEIVERICLVSPLESPRYYYHKLSA